MRCWLSTLRAGCSQISNGSRVLAGKLAGSDRPLAQEYES